MGASTVTNASIGSYAPPSEASNANQLSEEAKAWPLWQRVLFRFFFVYLILQIAPWNWLGRISVMRFVLGPLFAAEDWAVRGSNAAFFHVRPELVAVNGSGDTSWAWTQLLLYLSVAAVVCVVWSLLDRKRPNYERLALWLRMSVRYYIASAALSYGIIKLFALQMPFPTLSQLATPVGDLLPMRFSWFFIGYSIPYQFFSGAMETTAGLLLLYRRTVTAGLFAATGAFMNVVMINLAYDVPVKLYASHLLFACLFLLALDSKRLLGFLVLNRGAPPTDAYDWKFTKPWQVWGSRAAKAYLLWIFLWLPLNSGWTRFDSLRKPTPAGPFAAGVYDVRRYVVGHDTIPAGSLDSLRWRDVIFDDRSSGSVNTTDSVFWQRYHRGYFKYRTDPATHTATVWKTSTIPRDSTFMFTMRYEVPDSSTIRLHTMIRGDSIHVELARVPRHFQLTERQFHWISEYNR